VIMALNCVDKGRWIIVGLEVSIGFERRVTQVEIILRFHRILAVARVLVLEMVENYRREQEVRWFVKI
jgi:hypothetical protein